MDLRSTLGVLLLLALLALPLPVWAQESEDDDEESGFGYLVVEIQSWISQPSGLNYAPATQIDPSNVFATQVLSPDIGTKSEQYTKIGYKMPGKMGTFMMTFLEHDEGETALQRLSPGEFIYGETLAHPLFAGFGYDGLADYVDANFETRLTEFRFDFIRKAFERPKVSADWFVGVRRVKHRRNQAVVYNALVPPLPALLPPLGGPFPALDPLPDSAALRSKYTGRGLEAGMDFRIPMIGDKLKLEAGFAVALVRGDTDASYRSQTRYYVLNVQGTETLLFPPFPEFEQTRENPAGSGIQTPLAAETEQRTLQIGLSPDRIDTASQVIEAHVALKWKFWKDFTASLGFRSTRYSDVGVDLRPEVFAVPGELQIVDGELTGVNLQSFSEISRSVTYEGAYLGVGYRY